MGFNLAFKGLKEEYSRFQASYLSRLHNKKHGSIFSIIFFVVMINLILLDLKQ